MSSIQIEQFFFSFRICCCSHRPQFSIVTTPLLQRANTSNGLFSMYNINLITLLTNNFHFSSGVQRVQVQKKNHLQKLNICWTKKQKLLEIRNENFSGLTFFSLQSSRCFVIATFRPHQWHLCWAGLWVRCNTNEMDETDFPVYGKRYPIKFYKKTLIL